MASASDQSLRMPSCLSNTLQEYLSEAYIFTTPSAWVRGLLFREQRIAIFLFPRLTHSAFHSLGFTHALGMISLARGEVREAYLLKPWRIWKPKEAYDMMIEIPLVNEAYVRAWQHIRSCLSRA